MTAIQTHHAETQLVATSVLVEQVLVVMDAHVSITTNVQMEAIIVIQMPYVETHRGHIRARVTLGSAVTVSTAEISTSVKLAKMTVIETHHVKTRQAVTSVLVN